MSWVLLYPCLLTVFLAHLFCISTSFGLLAHLKTWGKPLLLNIETIIAHENWCVVKHWYVNSSTCMQYITPNTSNTFSPSTHSCSTHSYKVVKYFNFCQVVTAFVVSTQPVKFKEQLRTQFFPTFFLDRNSLKNVLKKKKGWKQLKKAGQ